MRKKLLEHDINLMVKNQKIHISIYMSKKKICNLFLMCGRAYKVHLNIAMLDHSDLYTVEAEADLP